MTDEILQSLRSAARAADVSDRFRSLIAGEHVNATEDRAVLHMALRGNRSASYEVDGLNVMDDIHGELSRMKSFVDEVRANPRITDIVNIGIGGSDLGPAMAAQALAGAAHPRLKAHFVYSKFQSR